MLVEPDRAFKTIGNWKISTARFGNGCVALYGYDYVYSVSIGGQTLDKLSIVIEADPRLFTANLDEEPYVLGVELVLGKLKVKDLRPYGYRGTSGVVAIFDSIVSSAFSEIPSLQLTERDAVKLNIRFNQTKEAMDGLTECFSKAAEVTRGADPSPNVKPFTSSSQNLPKRIGQCSYTSITAITDRFDQKLSPSPPTDGFDPGTKIRYANDVYQFSYEKETAIIRSAIGDKVQICLIEIPKNCPPGDSRGRVYNTKNLRTGEAWSLPDSQHSCGGA